MIDLLEGLSTAERLDPQRDFAADLASVLDDGHKAWFPERQDSAGNPIPYRIATPLDVPGAASIDAAAAAEIRGPSAGPLFSSFGSHGRARINGGRWTVDQGFWSHDGPPVGRTIEMARFENLTIRSRGAAFVFRMDAIAVKWTRCRFLGGTAGVRFLGLANIIKFEGCSFQGIQGPAIDLHGDPRSDSFLQRLGFRVAMSSVEDCDWGLVSRSSAANVDVYGCRFARNRQADVDFELHSQALLTHNVTVRSCRFRAPAPGQRFRIRTAGRVALTAGGNHVELDPSPAKKMVFVRIEPPPVAWRARTWLEHNRILNGWSPQPNDVLFASTAPACVQVTP